MAIFCLILEQIATLGGLPRIPKLPEHKLMAVDAVEARNGSILAAYNSYVRNAG